jgi:histidyl-tRNA synthetase
MSNIFQPPPGTRDFYPEAMAIRRFIEDTWRRVSIRHGFVEVDGPTFEYLDLYKVKSGDEIVSQLFHFESRGEDKTQFALRPEFTPTLARMVAAKANALPRPIKWFSIPRCYRAERPQKGRLREFIQWNVDMLADPVTGLRSTRECMALCIDAIREFGFTPKEVRLAWNNRHLMTAALQDYGFAESQIPGIFVLIDKIEKIENQDRQRLYAEHGLNDSQAVVLNEIAAGRLPRAENATNPERISQLLQEFQREAEEVGIAEFCDFDPRIVRGLAYYTGFVFEVFDAQQRNRAVAGGGQYDKLIELFGGPSLHAVGFGMGDVVLEILLRNKNKLPANLLPRPDVFVVSALDDLFPAQTILAELRASQWNKDHTEIICPGLSAITSYKATKNIGKLVGEASSSGARFAIILAPDEWSRGVVKLRDLATREEREIPAADIVEQIHAALSK